jgi:hypothetical protein
MLVENSCPFRGWIGWKGEQLTLPRMELTATQIPTAASPAASRFLALAAARLEVFRRSAIWRSLTWESGTWKSLTWKLLVGRARSQRKTLSIRETVGLGDRRFVSVIQFERQRFLIGSSPSAVTLLAHLADESAAAENAGEREKS